MLSTSPSHISENQLPTDDLQNLVPRSDFFSDDNEGPTPENHIHNFFDGWVSAVDICPNSYLSDPSSHLSHFIFLSLLVLQAPVHREQNGTQEHRCLSSVADIALI